MSGAEILLIAAGAVAVVAVCAIWSGYVLSILWAWFLVPFGLPEIGVAHAIGIVLIARMLKGMPAESENKRPFLRIGSWFVGTLLLLFVGYIAKGYVRA